MDSEQRRKRKRIYKPYGNLLSVRSLIVCLSFFVFLLFISSDRSPIRTGSFSPVLVVPASFSLLHNRLALTRDSYDTRSLPLIVQGRVTFPDHLMLIVSNKLHTTDELECVYYIEFNSVSAADDVVLKPAISVDDYLDNKSVVRCHLPPSNYSAVVNLRRSWEPFAGDRLSRVNRTAVVPSWDRVVYEAMLDGNKAVVFVKGLNLRPHRESDSTHFRCHFGMSNSFDENEGFVFTTKAIAAAQEVIRCLLPRSIQNNPEKAQGIRVTVSHVDDGEYRGEAPLPSVAKVYSPKSNQQRGNSGKYELCACTMLWNQASFMREWILYHAWLGVERWFIYDNNSDDGIQQVIDELNSENYNVTRHAWPWIKAQEAGFSHCALRARSECKWLGFFDVDEFFYLPRSQRQDIGRNSLQTLVANYTDSPTYAEIRTTCHSFGPSGLTTAPSQGVTVGYSCRLQAPERHKSIVRPERLDVTLLNVVHHFKLRDGYRYVNLPESTAVVNHYKYQAWDTFKAKFFRRVSTYVTNWQEEQNKGSKDRAPGLGTVAVEPPDWRLRFCEVWDTGLKDFVLANFADAATGYLPWERSPL
ncbi:glycosyltransferase family 92 protein RCOM_0530710 [Euphorbia lathyris]|uniref:glycosyltransferase family 92 protein RCOM_0530710 n=1 Tax=Euphorbia lathyris TaxID=212925 RepID=UPI0033130BDE